MRQIASFVLILVPAAYLWWSGRRLIRRIDDPAFPELRFAGAQRLVFIIAVSIAFSWLLDASVLVLKGALLLLALLIAGFPARRAIFEESWSLLAYLDHNLRVWASGLGLWLLLALQPSLTRWAGAAALPTAIFLFIALLIYSHFNDRLLPRFLRAVPLVDLELEDRFRSVMSGARCAMPRLLRIDAPGGRWVNAFALPSRKHPAVLLTGGLLEALTPAETQAIFAHEVAHLEYFHPGRMVQRELAVGLLALAPLLVVLLYGARSSTVAAMTWLWPLVVLLVLVALMAHNQKREHDSDLRALELVREPEPLVSALTKIHHLMKMPRRWRPDAENRMSHPSLAKRLRAIRDAAASQGLAGAPSQPHPEVVVPSSDTPGEWVILATDRLHWLSGVDPSTPADAATLLQAAADSRSMRYSDLRDLRLEARGAKRRQLIVVDSRGKTLKLPIVPGDVESVKGAIESLDLKVEGTALDAARHHARQATQRRNMRILGVLACLVALLPPFSLPLLVAGVLVLARVSTASLAASGAIALGAALVGGRVSPYFGGEASPALLIATALLGSLFLVAAFRRARQKQPDEPGALKIALLTLAALAILYTIPGLGRFLAPLPAMQLHLWARHQPALALALLGLTAALLASRSRIARLPAVAAGATAAVLLLIGTPWFRDHFSEDVIASTVKTLAAPAWKPAKIRELTIAGNVTELRLAPSGLRIAARVYHWGADDYHTPEWTFKYERHDGTLADIEALDLAFLGDDRAAVLRASPQGLLFLQTLDLEPEPTVESEILLPALDLPILRVDAAAGIWEVVEADSYEGSVTLVTGGFDSEDYHETHWTRLHPSADSYISAVIANAGPQALVMSQRYAHQPFAPLAMMLAPAAGLTSVYDIELVMDSLHTPLAQTALPVWCVEPPAGRTRFVCASNDYRSATHFWSIDGTTLELSLIGSLPAAYYQGRLSPDGMLLVGGYGAPPVLINPSSGASWTLDLSASAAIPDLASEAPNDEGPAATGDGVTAGFTAVDWLLSRLFDHSYSGPFYEAIALRERVLAVASPTGESSTVTLYRLEGWEADH